MTHWIQFSLDFKMIFSSILGERGRHEDILRPKRRTSLCDLLSLPPGKPTYNLTPPIISKHTYVCCHCQGKLPCLNLFLSAAQNRDFKLSNRSNMYVQHFHIILWQLPGATLFLRYFVRTGWMILFSIGETHVTVPPLHNLGRSSYSVRSDFPFSFFFCCVCTFFRWETDNKRKKIKATNIFGYCTNLDLNS